MCAFFMRTTATKPPSYLNLIHIRLFVVAKTWEISLFSKFLQKNKKCMMGLLSKSVMPECNSANYFFPLQCTKIFVFGNMLCL